MTRALSRLVALAGVFTMLAATACALQGVLAAPARALDVPALTGHVNDQAGLLAPSEREALERKLTAYEQQSGQQFALLTVRTLDGDALEDFSMRVVEGWKLGEKGKDDGLLMLIAVDDRKMRIEVGYGLEGDVPDAYASRVIRDVLTPAFRAQAFAQGIFAAFDALMAKASGQAPPEPVASPSARRSNRGSRLFPLLLGLLLLLMLGGGGRGGRRRRAAPLFIPMGGGGFFGGGRGGGGFGGGGGRFGGGGASGGW